MAIVVLVLWLLTAGAGFSVLITSNLKRDRAVPAAQLVSAEARTAAPVPAAPANSAPPPASPQETQKKQGTREAKPTHQDRFDPPSLVAARNAPVVPGARALLEFAHPAFGSIGLAFWLGFSLVHNRALGWIGFGLAAATACAGLAWFAINVRAAKRHDRENRENRENRDPADPAPSFRGRLVALHGAGAALTFVLAALSAVVLRG
jgi:hypothetical protein